MKPPGTIRRWFFYRSANQLHEQLCAARLRVLTAIEEPGSRHFSDLLDAVERGETITIVRGNHPVAEIGPAQRRTGAGLRAALADVPPPDEEFSRHIAEAVALLRSEVNDPWADA
jgi:antitoxin (DNA-binding transcriptional repressor) of toxin-antitoxin stability system